MRRCFAATVGGLALAIVLAVPAASNAAEVTIENGTLIYRASPSEVNSLYVRRTPVPSMFDAYQLRDAGSTMVVTPLCALWPTPAGAEVRCPVENVERLYVDAGDQADLVWMSGRDLPPCRRCEVEVPAYVRGGPGADVLRTGLADDVVDAFDHTRDTITCQRGMDIVYADAEDSVAADCETIHNEPAPGSEPPPEPLTLTVDIAPRYRLRRALFEGVAVRVSCSEACDVEARLLLAARRARRLGLGDGSQDMEVGRATATLQPATETRLAIELTEAARRAFRRLRRLTLTLHTQATSRDDTIASSTRLLLRGGSERF